MKRKRFSIVLKQAELGMPVADAPGSNASATMVRFHSVGCRRVCRFGGISTV
ncbi:MULTISPECIES: hypothetical protein [Burkholderia]|uniref:Uncharacterized protein n=1 Tax=Burkholderia paludis TaxID=1506587 RepID=A0A6J5E1W3_9BURK|nr:MULTISPECIES: hypothetical protein [Burkholderia]CAB3759997.1 hypothetical protein LMG30113_03579 [Burkholderia paludis]VWC06446.1 hypothetical protein BPA30113_05006 [Burkholderia paludis]